MNILVLTILFVFPPSAAFAKNCASDDSCPHPPKTQKDQDDLVLATKSFLNSYDQYLQAKQDESRIRGEALRSNTPSKWKEWQRQQDLVEILKGSKDRQFKQLIEDTQKAYGAKPKTTSGPIGKLNRSVFAGVPTRWNPVFVEGDVYVASTTVKTPAGDQEFYVVADFTADQLKFKTAVTLANGDVAIHRRVLEQVVALKDSSNLAADLIHEGIHYTDLVKIGALEANEREVRAYSHELAALKAWQVWDGRISAVQGLVATFEEGRRLGHRVVGYGSDLKPLPPYLMYARHVFETKEAQRSIIKKQQAQLQERIQKDNEQRKTKREEAARKAQEKRQGERIRQERETSIKKWILALFAEAKNCGFSPTHQLPRDITSSWWGSYEKYIEFLNLHGWTGGGVSTPIRIQLHGDIEVNKARFMLRRACQDAWSSNYLEPCNDSMPLISRSWKDSSFRYGLATINDNFFQVSSCLGYVIGDPAPPRSWTELSDRMKLYGKIAKARNEQIIKRAERNSKEAARQRPTSEFQSRPDMKDCLWGNCVEIPDRISIPSFP